MMMAVVLLAGLLAVAAILALLALRRAPEGYEDEAGFHASASTPRARPPVGQAPAVDVAVGPLVDVAGGNPCA